MLPTPSKVERTRSGGYWVTVPVQRWVTLSTGTVWQDCQATLWVDFLQPRHNLTRLAPPPL